MTTCNFRKKTLHTSFFVYFAFIFSECIKITSFEEVLKVCEHYFLQEIQVESSVTFNLPVQSRVIQVNFLHVEYDIWRSLEYTFYTNITRTSFTLLCGLSTRSTCLSNRSICLPILSTRSTICRSFYNWSALCFDMYFFIKK